MATRWHFCKSCFQPCLYKWHWVQEVGSEVCKWYHSVYICFEYYAKSKENISIKEYPSFEHNVEAEPGVDGTTRAQALVFLWSAVAYVLNVTLVVGGTGSIASLCMVKLGESQFMKVTGAIMKVSHWCLKFTG